MVGLLLAFAALAAQDDPCPDHTGIRWARPFKTALEQSKTGHRILMIKPVLFGTSPDGGW